jgi:SNF2 family DNA or RNA helicase
MFMLTSIFIKKYLSEKIASQKMAGNLSRLSSMLAKSTIDLNPHQIHAALYAFNSPLSRGAILADEVGLGKTIEAGIIIAQLWAEGKRRILILCPASLRNQWQDELLTKFGLESEVWDGPSFNARVNSGEPTPLTYDGIFITSYNFVYTRLKLIEKQPWNAVIIDEAHRFRRVYKGRDASKMAYDIREVIKDKPKALLTATPLQNNLEELYGIASFIDDKLLGTPYSFKTRFIEPIKENPELAKATLQELRRLIRGEDAVDQTSISGVITRTLRRQVLQYVPFTERTSLTFDFTPTDEEVELYEKVSAYLQRPEVAAIAATQRNLMILVYRKLLASSSFAIAATLKKLIENLRQELEMRSQETTEVNPEAVEDEGLVEELEEAELEGAEQIARREKQRVDSKFTDEDIKKEISELEGYYSLATKITINTKGEALIAALEKLFAEARKNKWPEKAVIFTESTRTQEYLAGLLADVGISFTLFNGSNNSPEARKAFEQWRKEFPEAASVGSASANTRQALIHDFKTNTQVLLTTEAGAEGLNLQFCNIVINYDLPWNPQRVEQRIGRCHRYGQRYQVVVANFLNTKNYADRRVLELLQEKLNLFDGLFGSSDEILGALESGVDFEKKILAIYQHCRTPEEYDKAFAELQESLKESISTAILEYRKLLLENTDQAVAELFKRTELETKRVISEFDEDLLRLCRLSLASRMRPTEDEAVFAIEGYELPIAFRELKDDEEGKISRAHKDHPLIKSVVAEALSIKTAPIPSLVFHLSRHGKKISQLQNAGGAEGFLFLWKLKASGIEMEETVVPMAFVKQSDTFKPIDAAASSELLSVNAEDTSKTLAASPIKKDEILAIWNEWKKPVLEKHYKRNERLFDRETDRINRYYDDYALRVEDKMKKLEDEKAEVNRKRDNSADMEERRKYAKRLQDISIAMGKLQLEQVKLRQEAEAKRQKELEELNKKIDPAIAEELIAVTHFEIR